MVKRMSLQLPRDNKIFTFMYVRVTNNIKNKNTINEWPVLGLQHFNNNNKEKLLYRIEKKNGRPRLS
jgi:hypothetical protein